VLLHVYCPAYFLNGKKNNMQKIGKGLAWLLAWTIVGIAYFPMRAIWTLQGWRFEGEETIQKIRTLNRFVVLGVPHTTNWDYWHMLNTALYARRRPYTIVKVELLKPPFGWFIRAAGGIGVDRSKSQRVSDQLAEQLTGNDKYMLVFAPEGTRSYRPYWKTGFYYSALKAEVPIVCAYADYERKILGLGLVLYPTGDIEADFAKIAEFYGKYGRKGLHPEKMSDLAIDPSKLPSAQDQQSEDTLSV
jgi:1-acyl-sn-glycerol-3-phosphate acyltransferase